MSRIVSHLLDRIKAIPREVEATAVAKIGQGATETSNALFSQSNAYSPVTADKAADVAHRARFQKQDQGRVADR